MLYELILIFVLFQHKDDVRRLLVYIDPTLGTPLEEMDYRYVVCNDFIPLFMLNGEEWKHIACVC